MTAPFTPAQEARLRVLMREAMIIHSIGATMAGHIARRHYTLFYGRLDALASQIAATPKPLRDRLIRAIAEEARAAEVAERHAVELAEADEALRGAEQRIRDSVIANLARPDL